MPQRLVLRSEPRLDAKHQSFPFQEEAALAVRDLNYAAVFHEQGLGKTKIAIDIMLYWLETKQVDTVLFVAKRGLIQNWLRELQTHTFLSPRILDQNHANNHNVFNSPSRVLLTHFEVMRSEQKRMELFLRTRVVGVIVDESAKIKNPDSALTHSFHDLAPLFARRIIMTGTPVANRPEDIWSQVYFLDQGASLGHDFKSFKKFVALSNDLFGDESGQNRFEQALSEMFAKIEPFAVRETKSSAGISLPNKQIENMEVDWEPHQFDLYARIRDELRASVLRDGLPVEDDAEAILKRLLRMVQVASNPRLVDSGYHLEPGKLDPLRNLVGSIHDRREKVIVWSSFTDNVDWIARELSEFGPRRVHGKMSMEDRDRSLGAFMANPQCEVLVATPGAAKEGLTLTAANHVVFYDRSFSLDDYLQAQDRVHRISQSRTCFVTNLVMRDSIDEWVNELLNAKYLAAQLLQRDTGIDAFRKHMTYDYGDMLRHVLDPNLDGG